MYGNVLCGFGYGPVLWSGPWLPVLLMILLTMLTIFGLGRRTARPDSAAANEETALAILDRRYAAGDLREQEYLSMKRHLGR